MASERTQRQIDRLLDEAEEAFTHDDWSRLSDRARRALLLDPDNRDAINFLAAAERAAGGSGVIIEPELINGVGSVAGNVGHEGKFVGRVSLHGVSARGRFQPLNGWPSYRSVIPDRVYRRVGTLIVGG